MIKDKLKSFLRESKNDSVPAIPLDKETDLKNVLHEIKKVYNTLEHISDMVIIESRGNLSTPQALTTHIKNLRKNLGLYHSRQEESYLVAANQASQKIKYLFDKIKCNNKILGNQCQYSVKDCLMQLKYGRPEKAQQFIDKLISFCEQEGFK